jgi:hypothetical protein
MTCSDDNTNLYVHVQVDARRPVERHVAVIDLNADADLHRPIDELSKKVA